MKVVDEGRIVSKRAGLSKAGQQYHNVEIAMEGSTLPCSATPDLWSKLPPEGTKIKFVADVNATFDKQLGQKNRGTLLKFEVVQEQRAAA